MQELVLILTGVAGAASAVAYKRLPLGGRPRGGSGMAGRRPRAEGRPAAGRIRDKIHALAAERDVLGKAISRVRDDPSLDGRQRDALLSMYQQQLGTVLAKMDRLEEASRYPDIGPVGDGLIALMDQKLSSLDEKLHEMSARMAAAAAAAGAAGAGAGAPSPAGGQAKAGGHGGKGIARKAAAKSAEGAGALEAAAGAGALEAAGAPAAAAATDASTGAAALEAAAGAGAAGARGAGAASGGPGRARSAAQGQLPVKPVEITTLTTINGSQREFPAVGRGGGKGAGGAKDPGAGGATRTGDGPGTGKGHASGDAPPGGAGGKGDGVPGSPGQSTRVAAGAAPPPASPLPQTLPKPPASIDAGGGGGVQEKEAGGGGGGKLDDDDVAAIMADIRSTLSKLEQAEVE